VDGKLQDTEASKGQRCARPEDAFAVYDSPHGRLAMMAMNPMLASLDSQTFESLLTANNQHSATPLRFAAGAIVNNQQSERTISYQYDQLYRLTDANYCNGFVTTCPASAAFRAHHYAYDLMGNRTTARASVNGQPVSDVTFDYNPANQLTTTSGFVDGQSFNHTFSYDLAGRLTGYGDTTFAWDAADRLTSISNPQPEGTISNQYNGYGDRYSQTVNGVETTYTLDYNTSLTQVLAETTSGQTTTYLPGLGQQTGAGDWQYFLTDGLGSVRQLTDSQGDVTYAASYDPYGNPLPADYSTTELPDPATNVGHWRTDGQRQRVSVSPRRSVSCWPLQRRCRADG